MEKYWEKLKDTEQVCANLRKAAVESVTDAHSAALFARALVLIREAGIILDMERNKLEEGSLRGSDAMQVAFEWNMRSAASRLVMARDILNGEL